MSNKYPGGFVSLGGPLQSYSVAFDGTGDYLTVPASTAFNFGTGDFTIEFWSFLQDTNALYAFDMRYSGGNETLCYLNSTSCTVDVNGVANAVTGLYLLNTWTHIAIVRASGTVNTYINGTNLLSFSSSGSIGTSGVSIGARYNGVEAFLGKISNFRMVKGVAVYTANFAAPTAPLQNISGTSLLTCQSPTIVDNSSNGFTVTAVGNAAVSTAQPPFQAYNPNNLDPALGAATPGVWTLSQALAAEVTRSWPMYDPYYKNVVLNLHGDGTNAAQNNTFVDSSSNNFTITRNGNTTQGSFSPYGSNWSNYFNVANPDYLSVANNAAFTLGSTWSIEAWVNPTTLSGSQTIVGRWYSATNNASYLLYLSGNYIKGGVFPDYSNDSGLTPIVGQWNHIVMTSDGSKIRFFLNGQLGTVATGVTTNINTDGALNLTIGGNTSGTAGLTGYISNVRLTKNAIPTTYQTTSTTFGAQIFTPPTAPLTTSSQGASSVSLLTCQSNRFIDNSSNASPLTVNGSPSVQRFQPFLFNTSYTPSTIGGSGYFDGTGDYLKAANNAALQLGSSDFTIECWYYSTVAAGDVLWSKAANGSAYTGYYMNVQGAGRTPVFYATANGSSWAVALASSITLKLNSWNHIAVTRSGSTWTVWVNGVSGGTATSSATVLDDGSSFTIGALNDGTAPITGYVSDLRVVKGTAVYSNTFTPPTAPLTAIANTSLLTNMTNAAIYDNAAMNDLETVGNAQISTSVKKYGTGSMSFPTTGDYLTTLATSNLSFGTGDFTVEGWMYFNTVGSDMTLFTGTTNGNISIRIVSSQIRVGTLGVSWDTSSATQSFSTATWYHFAVVRSSGTITFYLNGVSIGSGANTNAYNVSAGATIAQAGGGAHLDGYLDDLRITKGVARYVANFTPPTSQLQDQ